MAGSDRGLPQVENQHHLQKKPLDAPTPFVGIDASKGF